MPFAVRPGVLCAVLALWSARGHGTHTGAHVLVRRGAVAKASGTVTYLLDDTESESWSRSTQTPCCPAGCSSLLCVPPRSAPSAISGMARALSCEVLMTDNRPLAASFPLAEAAVINRLYASRWGCRFTLSVPTAPRSGLAGAQTTWCKLTAALTHVERQLRRGRPANHWIILIDSDAYLASPTQSPEQLLATLSAGRAIPDLIVGREDRNRGIPLEQKRGCLNGGVVLVRASEWSRSFLAEWGGARGGGGATATSAREQHGSMFRAQMWLPGARPAVTAADDAHLTRTVSPQRGGSRRSAGLSLVESSIRRTRSSIRFLKRFSAATTSPPGRTHRRAPAGAQSASLSQSELPPPPACPRSSQDSAPTCLSGPSPQAAPGSLDA